MSLDDDAAVDPAEPGSPRAGDDSRSSQLVALAALLMAIVVPLSAAGWHLESESRLQATVDEVARHRAGAHAMEFTDLSAAGEHLTLTFEGAQPLPDIEDLSRRLEVEGVPLETIEVRLVPVTTLRPGEG